jgi:serine protease Do
LKRVVRPKGSQMRISLAERFHALSSPVPRAPAGRRSPRASRVLTFTALLLWAALAGTPLSAASPAPSPEPEKPLSTAEILGAVVRIHVQTVANARSASSAGRERHGSGVVVEPGGLILTSALLVQEADAIVVTTLDARTVPAAVAAHDPALGIAVLRPAAPLGVRPLSVGRSAMLAPRAWVSVASAARHRTVSVAEVIDKRDFANEREFLVEDAIFTAPVVPECAGAALVDGTGKLIGIGALAVKEVRGPEAAFGPGNVFIPVERFLPALSRLARADGSSGPRRPWLGLVTRTSDLGLVVTDVPPDSPAERAGLRVGDAIAAVDGTPVRTHAELYRSVWRTGVPGTAIRLTIRRDGTTREVRIRAIEVQDYLIHRARLTMGTSPA